MKIRLWLVLGVVLLASFAQVSAETPQTGTNPSVSIDAILREGEREMLRGLNGVLVVVEGVKKEVEDKGLTTDALRTCVELQLRKAGIKILNSSITDTRAMVEAPLLALNVGAVVSDSGFVAYHISLEHSELGQFKRNGMPCSATMWARSYTGTVGVNNLKKKITELVSEMADQYANDYLVSVRKRAVVVFMQHIYSTRIGCFLGCFRFLLCRGGSEACMDIRTTQGDLKDSETRGVQASRWRARVWRLKARTASCT